MTLSASFLARRPICRLAAGTASRSWFLLVVLLLGFGSVPSILAQTLGSARQEASMIYWQCDFSAFDQASWTWNNCHPGVAGNALRLQVQPNSPGNQATFQTTIPASPGDAFLQVWMGELENASAKPCVGKPNRKGVQYGCLFPGWNTFPMVQAGKDLPLELGQLGGGKEAGPWVDYRLVRIVRQPIHGLTVTVLNKQPGAPLEVGDQLLFQYFAENSLGNIDLPVDCFLYPQMVDYRLHANMQIMLNDRGADGDRQANDLIYSAVVTIDERTLQAMPEDQAVLMAAVKVVDNYSYYSLPNELAVKTGNPIPKALIAAGNLQTRKDRQLWFDLTSGKNLALGKKLTLAPTPDYRLTKDDNDVYDLTDGELTTRSDDKVWFDRQSVGWYMGNGEAYLKLDLGKLEKIDRLVIRCLGGTVGNFQFPRSFQAYVSRDDDKYFLAREMQKLMPGESDQSDFIGQYYIEEQGSMYATRMYPFQLTLQAEARYLILKITGTSGSIFSDEMAVLEAEAPGPGFNAAYQNPGQVIPLEGLLVKPRLGTLDLIRGIPAPQAFAMLDLRPADSFGAAAELVLDLPPGVTVQYPEVASETIRLDGADYLRVTVPIEVKNKKLSAPNLFLEVSPRCRGKLPAWSMARTNGVDHYRSRLPLQIVSLPPIPRFQRLHVSLSWMSEGYGMNWPNFFKQWEKLGFNTVSSFPRWWKVNDHQEQRDYVNAAHEHGYKVIMNDSAFHEMMRGHKEGSEIFCDIPDRQHKMLCPSYRGQFYDKEMERVARCVRTGVPDFVFYDIECWTRMNYSAALCRRCQEGMKKSGKSLEDFLLDCRVEHMRDLDAAVRRGAAEAGIPVPVQGDYARDFIRTSEFFPLVYPQYINIAMPSLYVAGRAVDVHKRIRGNYRQMQVKQQIPWLSTGTYGEFEPFKVEQMVLEALLNGASGITYYCFRDFTDSPHDFYYHAKALAMLRPHEDLIMDGEVIEPTGANELMFYSAIKNNQEMLLLVGNYYKADENTTVALPWNKLASVTDLQTKKKVRAKTNFNFKVPKGGFRLFHIKGK